MWPLFWIRDGGLSRPRKCIGRCTVPDAILDQRRKAGSPESSIPAHLPVFFLLFLSPLALLQEYNSGEGENIPTKIPEKVASFALKGPRMLENKRRRSGWRGLRPSCWRQVPITLQIRPIDRGRDHKPLIRLGDRGPSRLALIRERALSHRPVHSLLQVPSVNASCLCPGRQHLSPQVGTRSCLRAVWGGLLALCNRWQCRWTATTHLSLNTSPPPHHDHTPPPPAHSFFHHAPRPAC